MDNMFNLGGPAADPFDMLAQQGASALSSGQVTKAEAKKMQKQMKGKDPGDFLSSLSMIGGPPKKPSTPSPLWGQENDIFNPQAAAPVNPEPVAATPPPAPAGPPVDTSLPLNPSPPVKIPNEILKEGETSVDTTGGSKHRTTTWGPEEWAKLTDVARNTPEVKAQGEGVKDLENQLAMMSQAQQPRNDAWVKPLLAWADSMKPGSHLLSGYEEPNQEKNNAMLLKYMDELSKRKGDMAKAIMESGTKLKAGQDMEDFKKALTQTSSQQVGEKTNPYSEARMEATKMRVGPIFNNDARVKTMENVMDNLDKAHSFINGSTPITASVFNTLQDDLSTAIRGGGGSIADAARQRDQLHSMQQEWNALEAKFGNIQDMRKEAPQLFTQLKSMVETVRGDTMKAYKSRVNQIKKGFSGNNSDIQKVAADMADELVSKRTTGEPLEDLVLPGKAAPAAAAPAGKKLEDMSDAELNALHAKVTGKGG